MLIIDIFPSYVLLHGLIFLPDSRLSYMGLEFGIADVTKLANVMIAIILMSKHFHYIDEHTSILPVYILRITLSLRYTCFVSLIS